MLNFLAKSLTGQSIDEITENMPGNYPTGKMIDPGGNQPNQPKRQKNAPKRPQKRPRHKYILSSFCDGNNFSLAEIMDENGQKRIINKGALPPRIQECLNQGDQFQIDFNGLSIDDLEALL